MGEVANQHFQDQSMKNIYDDSNPKFGSWAIVNDNGSDHDSISMDSSFEDSSTNSGASSSSSSSDLLEDASSSSSSYSSLSPSMSHSKGPLYELSDLMLQLPIKRGLSKFYQGKSQSYTSLAQVKSIDDLAKKGVSYSKRMKSCKSYANIGLDGHKYYSPKATISKKTPRVSFLSLQASRATLVNNCKPPISYQKNF